MEPQDWRAACVHGRRARTRARLGSRRRSCTKTRGPVRVLASAQRRPCTHSHTHAHANVLARSWCLHHTLHAQFKDTFTCALTDQHKLGRVSTLRILRTLTCCTHASTWAEIHFYTCDGDTHVLCTAMGLGQGCGHRLWESAAAEMLRGKGETSFLPPPQGLKRPVLGVAPRSPRLGRASAYRPSGEEAFLQQECPPKSPRVNQPWPPFG